MRLRSATGLERSHSNIELTISIAGEIVQVVEPRVRVIEPRVRLIEPRVRLIETAVDLGETGLEPRVGSPDLVADLDEHTRGEVERSSAVALLRRHAWIG